MFVVLLLLGLLAAAAGFTAIGFGIPINSFSIGNTMIVAGSAGAAGGLVLIGLAVVVQQLQRIAARLAQPNRPPLPPTARMGPAGPDPRRHTDAPPRAAEPRNPPYRPLEQRPPERRAPPRAPEPVETETRVPPPPSPPPPPPVSSAPLLPDSRGPLSWLRAKPRLDASPEPPPAPAAPPPPRDSEPALPSPGLAPAADAEPPQPPPDNRPSDSALFDVDWQSKSAPPAADADKRDEPRSTFFTRMRNEPAPETVSPPPSPPPPPVERTPAILKSGVIDGMAYTLYADGSIEAEMPQGTLTFASVEALRLHLEKHGG